MFTGFSTEGAGVYLLLLSVYMKEKGKPKERPQARGIGRKATGVNGGFARDFLFARSGTAYTGDVYPRDVYRPARPLSLRYTRMPADHGSMSWPRVPCIRRIMPGKAGGGPVQAMHHSAVGCVAAPTAPTVRSGAPGCQDPRSGSRGCQRPSEGAWPAGIPCYADRGSHVAWRTDLCRAVAAHLPFTPLFRLRRLPFQQARFASSPVLARPRGNCQVTICSRCALSDTVSCGPRRLCRSGASLAARPRTPVFYQLDTE